MAYKTNSQRLETKVCVLIPCISSFNSLDSLHIAPRRISHMIVYFNCTHSVILMAKIMVILISFAKGTRYGYRIKKSSSNAYGIYQLTTNYCIKHKTLSL